MRRMLAAAAAVIMLTVIAACGSDNDAPASGASDPGATTATTAPDDLKAATAMACAEVVPLSEKAAAAFMADISKALEAAMAGNEADADKLEKALRDNLNAWATRLTELAGQPIAEPVKAAMTETAAMIAELNKPDDKTPVSQVDKKLKEAADKIATACA